MRMITGQFSDSYLPVVDGVSLTICNYLSELNRTLGPSCAVVPAVPGYSDPPLPETYRFLSLPLVGRPPYRLGLPQLDIPLHRALRSRHFDLLHAHTPFFAGRYALQLARRRRIPIVATFHSKYRDKLRRALPWRRLVEREVQRIVSFYASVDEVWVPTRSALQCLRDYGYRGAAEVVGHGIDFEARGDRTDLRRRGEALLRVDQREFVFLYVGEQAWEKNLAFLLQSLSLLRRQGRRFKMAFVGGGYAAKPLRLMAARLGLRGHTSFVGLLRDRDALSACYARADCFLFPSLYDTCGLVVKEAAAFGVPSVVLEASAAAEQILDGVNGFVTEGSVRSYAGKLAELLEHRDDLARAGEGARRTLCTSWTEAVQEVKERYLSLLLRSAGSCRSSAASGARRGQEIEIFALTR